jgi:hypothetical protein
MTASPSQREVEERRSKLAACFKSFPSFAGLLEIQPKEGGGRVPLILSPIQRRYHRARTARDIVLKSRQIWMTTGECARDLQWFLTKTGSRVVVTCQSQEGDLALKDISYKFQIFIDSIRRVMPEIKFGTDSTTEWTIPSRDSTLRIVTAGASEKAAGKKGRGGTINRLHVSEASSYEHAEETMLAMTESVARTGSEIVIESTPKGAVGWYYEQWLKAVEGASGYTPHFFEWWHHPEYRMPLQAGHEFVPVTDLEKLLYSKGVAPECLNWYRWKVAEKGGNAEKVNQEYPSDPDTCFLVSGRTFFDTQRCDASIRVAEEPIDVQYIREGGAHGQVVKDVEVPAIRIWHMPAPGMLYVIAADPSEGTGGDPSAGIVLERVTGRHMATIWGQFRPWELGRILSHVGRAYNWAWVAVERNNHGHACLRALESEHKYAARVFADRDGEHGWHTNEASRAPMLDTFEQAFRKGAFRTNDKFLLREMRAFIVTDHGRAEHRKTPGSHGDLVIAGGIAWDLICRPTLRATSAMELPIA